MRLVFFLVCLIILLSSCGSIPKGLYNDSPTRRIAVGPGPEDMALDTFSTDPQLIVSCSQRREGESRIGDFFAYKFSSDTVVKLPRINEPEGFFLEPHGIDIFNHFGRTYLYAISHTGTMDYVVIYKLQNDSLFFFTSTFNGLIYSPNDLSIAPDGSFYVSNDKFLNGNLVHCFIDGTCEPMAEKIHYANGVFVYQDDVFVSSTINGEIYRLKRRKTKQERVPFAEGIKGADNITRFENKLIITSHPKFLKFIQHVKNSSKISPSVVYSVSLSDGKKEVIFSDKTGKINTCSTGLIYNNKLYLSQIFEPFILEVSLPNP